MQRILSTAVAAVAIVASATAARAQHNTEWGEGWSADSSFAWKGAIPSSGTMRVENLNGSIDVQASDNGTTTVTGIKRWKRGDPARVHIVVEPHGDEVAICALWDEQTHCGEGYDHHDNDDEHHGRNNDVSVQFTVHLAKGVKAKLNTVNGGLSVAGVSGAVDANTVNGRIDVATLTGPVNAVTVNGSIHARFEHMDDSRERLELNTVNGSIDLEAPADLNVNLDAQTVNGGVQTDFPVQINSMRIRSQIRGTIGKGGRELRLETVNGSIRIKKLG